MPGFAKGALLLLAAVCALRADPARAVTPAELRAAVADSAVLRAADGVRRFYEARGYRPAWTGPGTDPRNSALAALRKAIAAAEMHGLVPADYHPAALGPTAAARRPVTAEILATDAYLTLGAHLLGGRLDPVTIQPGWSAPRPSRDLAAHLSAALAAGRVAESLDALAPDIPSYRALRRALARYRGIAAAGGWPRVPPGPALREGMRDWRVGLLRTRLEREGLLPPAPAARRAQFDALVAAAVAAYQRGLGLETDGIVGPMTLRELNRSAAERASQIRANLERLRWLPDDLGARHVRVNIADYRLEARAGGRIVREHDVIVGRTYRQTPVFSNAISYLVFNPWWETPASIARVDKLAEFRADPRLASRLGFDAIDAAGKLVDVRRIDWTAYTSDDFPFRLRQRPGPANALGRVKIMFPNAHNVYLHDTPTQGLFGHNRRDFSSGCVRVSDALGLAQWLLAGTPGWTRARIDAVVASGKETRVDLPRRVPVHILYLTAVGVDADGDGRTDERGIRFVADIYDHDPALIAALERAPVR